MKEARHRLGKKWTICSNGERIISFKNRDKNGAWDNKTVYLTAELKKLFEEYGVDYGSKLKANILSQEEKSFFVKLLHCLSNILQMRNSVTGGEIDYIISPVKDENGEFFDSRNSGDNLPKDADANGAYNIARKALWCIKQFKESDAQKISAIKNTEWLEFVQK